MFPVNYYPANYYAPRYWPPGGADVAVQIQITIENFYLSIKQRSTFDLGIVQSYSQPLELWQYDNFNFVMEPESSFIFDIVDQAITTEEIGKIVLPSTIYVTAGLPVAKDGATTNSLYLTGGFPPPAYEAPTYKQVYTHYENFYLKILTSESIETKIQQILEKGLTIKQIDADNLLVGQSESIGTHMREQVV
jgi:hypothetical protein